MIDKMQLIDQKTISLPTLLNFQRGMNYSTITGCADSGQKFALFTLDNPGETL